MKVWTVNPKDWISVNKSHRDLFDISSINNNLATTQNSLATT